MEGWGGAALGHTTAEPFTFLTQDFSGIAPPRRPVNVFQLAGFPRWETVASNVLAFFFDPLEPRHGLGTLALDALVESLHGAPTLTDRGRSGKRTFDGRPNVGSTAWAVETEHGTDDHKRIDIYLTNAELDLAIIVENKLDAGLDNPFESYARRALADFATVLTVVLAPQVRSLDSGNDRLARWTSAAVTYDQLFDRIRPRLATVDADTRSVDLFHQFMENTSERGRHMDASIENEVLEQFWGALRGHEASYRQFFASLSQVNGILEKRAESLHALIGELLASRGLVTHSFVSSGRRKRWGVEDGRIAVVYVGFTLVNGLTIELILGFLPLREQYGLHVKAYRGNAARPIRGYDWIALGPTLGNSDLEISAAFTAVADDLLAAYPSGQVE